jgi:hypothetical protein
MKKVPIIDIKIQDFKISTTVPREWELVIDVPEHKRWINQSLRMIIFIDKEMNEDNKWHLYTGFLDDIGGQLTDISQHKSKKKAEKKARALMRGE